MAIIDVFSKPFFKLRLAFMQSWIDAPQQKQSEILFQIIDTAKDTEWGKRFSYQNIHTYQEFSSRVPVSSYEDISSYVERMMKGERDILWPGLITNFARSSGTTNARSKFIPVSMESLEDNHFKAGKDMLAMYVSERSETQLFSGKHVAVGGSYSHLEKNKKMIVGDVSGLLMYHLPIWAELVRYPSKEIALLSDWEEKSERMSAEIFDKNITGISGVPTWTVHLLKKVLEKSGAKKIKEVWPHFEVFFHGGVSFTPYRELFQYLFDGLPVRFVEVYNASEGCFAIQDDTQKIGEMLLLLDHAIFYEFIPLDEAELPFPKVYTVADVRVGEPYALSITTKSGLTRYLVGDTITVTSLHPFRIKILGRTKQFINTFGEELMIGNAETAITRACTETESLVSDFTAGPIFMNENGKGGHEWIIEFSKAPTNLEKFNTILDTTLREINSDYDAKRAHDMALLSPIINVAPNGTFYEWMKSRGKLGGQHKVPRLSNTREYVDSILKILK